MEKNNTTTNEPNKENDVPVDSVQSGFINFSISKKKLTAVAILIIIIVAIILGLSIHYRNKLSALEEQLDIPEEQDIIEVTNEVQITTSTLREIIAPAKELVSYKYYYTDAGVFEKNKKLFDTDINIPFTKNQQVYVYSGTIGVGLNIDEINFDVDETSKKITISMPELTILYHEMDTKNFQSYDVKSSIFTKINLSEYADFEEELKEYQEDKLIEYDDFWDDARTNSEETIESLLSVSGVVDDYTISFNW